MSTHAVYLRNSSEISTSTVTESKPTVPISHYHCTGAAELYTRRTPRRPVHRGGVYQHTPPPVPPVPPAPCPCRVDSPAR